MRDNVRGPTKVDREIGERVRSFRTRAGVTLDELAERVGVTWQQVQKYERGQNRISASRLHAVSRALQVDIGDFFPSAED